MKQCKVCLEEKCTDEFYVSDPVRGYLSSYCKPCTRVKNREYHRSNDYERRRGPRDPRAQAISRKKHYAKLRSAAVEALGGDVCNYCGLDDARVLQIDHVNDDGYLERRELDQREIYRKIVQEPERYQMLCANCHVLKTLHGVRI